MVKPGLITRNWRLITILLLLLLPSSLLAGSSTGSSMQMTSNLEQGLVAYWKFDEGEGDIAFDASGNDNDITLVNRPSWSRSRINHALYFDGVNDYAFARDAHSLQIGEADFSISLWFKGQLLIAKAERWPNTGGKGITLYTRDSPPYIVLNWGDGNSSQYFGFSSVRLDHDNQWHHIVVSIDRDRSIKGFVDRILKSEDSVPRIEDISVKRELQIQRRRYSDNYLAGALDEFRIYNRALSEKEVESLYRMGSSDGNGSND